MIEAGRVSGSKATLTPKYLLSIDCTDDMYVLTVLGANPLAWRVLLKFLSTSWATNFLSFQSVCFRSVCTRSMNCSIVPSGW